MVPSNLLNELSPYARVATAVVPFVLAMLVRLFFGKTRVVGWLLTLTTMWFAAIVLLAPYSRGMRQDIHDLGRFLP